MVKRQQKHIQCVIPCGGSSTRLGLNRNKCLTEVGGKPVLAHVVDFWREQGVEDFIFIVGGSDAKEVTDLVHRLNTVTPVFIDRGETVNLAGAVLLAKPYIRQNFVLALGDCLNVGRFVVSFEGVDFGIGVCIADEYELRKNYLVEANSHRISRLVEKPKGEELGLCGMGTLFLNTRVFDYIERLRLPPQATSVDLTGTIQLAIGAGEEVVPIWFNGTYINITYPEDIEKAEEILK